MTRLAPPHVALGSIPMPELRPDLLQGAELWLAAHEHLEMLIRHRQRMIHRARVLHIFKQLLEPLALVAHHDHALARVPARPPVIIILVPGNGIRQAHFRSEEIDGTGLPIILPQNCA